MSTPRSGEPNSGRLSLLARTLRGTLWTVLAIAGGQGIRLASSLVLTRLLHPEAFGVMALMMVFVQAMQMFSDVGIGPSIIQNERGDEPRFLDTAWTVQVGRGAGIWLACAVIATPVAWFYDEPLLRGLLPILGFQAVLSGFNSTAVFTANRRLELGRLTVLELSVQALAFGATVLWALQRPDVSALVAGSIFGAAIRLALTWRLIPGYRNRFLWDRDAAREIIRFGKWIFMSTALGFLGSQIDRLLLPGLLSWEVFGVYTIAFMLTNVPDGVATAISGRVLFPAISQRTHLPRPELRALLGRYRRRLLLAAAPLVALLTHLAEPIVSLLYDPRYHEAGWMFALLSLGLWFRMLSASVSPALLAIGESRYFAVSALSRLVLVAAGLPLAHAAFGVIGAVGVAAAGPIVEYAVVMVGVVRHQLVEVRQDLLSTLAWAGALVVFVVLRGLLGLRPLLEGLL